MYLTQIPFYPANKADYDIEQEPADTQVLVRFYPEVMRCIACNSCTKICPQDIDVMGYINAAIRGDIEKVADMSFDCIMCGLCASPLPGRNRPLQRRPAGAAAVRGEAGEASRRTSPSG